MLNLLKENDKGEIESLHLNFPMVGGVVDLDVKTNITNGNIVLSPH